MLKFALIVFLCLSLQAVAQLNGTVDLSLRTKPLQYSGQLSGAYDGQLWGTVDKANGMYGFYRAGMKVGGSPTAALFLQVAPIAPVVFEIQQGTTYRVFKTDLTNCETNECLHKVNRTDYSVKIGGALKGFVLMSKFTLRDIQPESSTQTIFLENELFHVAPGHLYRYFENLTIAGYQIDERQTAGLLYNGGELTGSGAHFYSGYAVFMRKMDWADLAAGLGYYENSAVPQDVRANFNGFSALVLLSRSFGETMALF